MNWKKFFTHRSKSDVEQLRNALHAQIKANIREHLLDDLYRQWAISAANSAVDTVFLEVFIQTNQEGVQQ